MIKNKFTNQNLTRKKSNKNPWLNNREEQNPEKPRRNQTKVHKNPQILTVPVSIKMGGGDQARASAYSFTMIEIYRGPYI